jgi:hypothetical protein
MARTDAKTRHELARDLLLGALRVEDPALNETVLEIIALLGERMVPLLVAEALNQCHHPAHRVRALQALARIGYTTEPDCYFELLSLLWESNEQIRRAAELLGLN